MGFDDTADVVIAELSSLTFDTLRDIGRLMRTSPKARKYLDANDPLRVDSRRDDQQNAKLTDSSEERLMEQFQKQMEIAEKKADVAS